MRIIVAVLAVILAGCTKFVHQDELKLAFEMCAAHDGLYSIGVDDKRAYCRDGSEVSYAWVLVNRRRGR